MIDARTASPSDAPRTTRLPAREPIARDLPAADRRWLLRALAHLLAARLSLALLPLTSVPVRATSLDRDRLPDQAARLDTARRIGRAVDAAARLLPRTRCLAKGLAAQAFARRQGLPSRLHVGFLRTTHGALRGHAWLECEGEVVVGEHPHLDAFVPTMVFDA